MAREPEIVFESPADQAGFVMYPNVVLLDEGLSVTARFLYGVLVHFARQDGACFPGQERLGRLLKATDRTVRGYLRELEDAMLIRTERRGTGRSNRYVLLALGLRAKRLAERDRKPVSGQADRKPVSGVTGSQLPTTYTQKDEDAVVPRSARARVKISGKPVKSEAWDLTGKILTEFNSQAGRKLRLLTSAGLPSEAAKRIYGRVVAYPDLSFEEHADIIRRTLDSKWWWKGQKSGDAPSVGVVYGPAIFEENITRQPVKRTDDRAARNERRRRAFMQDADDDDVIEGTVAE